MRIGIAVKPGLTAATDTLAELEQQLETRGVTAVWSREAADLLLRMLLDGEELTAEVVLPTELVVRESTGPAPVTAGAR